MMRSGVELALLRLRGEAMREFLSRYGHPLLWFLGFSVPFILNLALLDSNIGGIACYAAMSLFTIFFLIWLLILAVKTVVNFGNNTASRMRLRKGYPEHEWTNAKMLPDAHRYIIGDDGELIELNIDEKRKHDDSNP
jgi:hypothetical protein